MLGAEEGQQGKRARCPSCGGLTTVPHDDAEAGLRQADLSHPDGPRAAELRCPECDERMVPGAVICIECGFDRRIGRRRKTKVKRVERDWVPPPGPIARVVSLFVAVLVVGGICIAVVMYGGPPLPTALTFAVLTGVTTLVAGWYDTLHLARNSKGALMLTQTTHILFIPLMTWSVDLAKCEAIQIDAGGSSGSVSAPAVGSIITLLFIALMFGWVGLFLLRPRPYCGPGYMRDGGGGGDTIQGSTSFAIHLLSRPNRDHVMTLYRGSNEDFMREIVDELAAHGELEIVR
jgi:hypothetical protein